MAKASNDWIPHPKIIALSWLLILACLMLVVVSLPVAKDFSALMGGIFAGASAMSAALIAYVGIAKKTLLEATLAAAARRDRAHNLMLLVDLVGHKLSPECQSAIDRTRKRLMTDVLEDGSMMIDAERTEWLFVPTPPQLSQIWADASMLPQLARVHLRDITINLERAQHGVSWADNRPRENVNYSLNQTAILENYGAVVAATEALLAAIEPELQADSKC